MSSSLMTRLGLRVSYLDLDSPPSISAAAIIWQFIFAYGVLSSRTLKQYYGLDHNVSPRDDLSKFGPNAVTSGKISQRQFDQLKRIEAAHANSVEHFPLFVGALIWAHMARLPTVEINRSALAYLLARIAYAAVYIFVDKPSWSQLRGLFWWTSDLLCFRLYWLGEI
jgi:uncharacterized MAPEG superfamily protein